MEVVSKQQPAVSALAPALLTRVGDQVSNCTVSPTRCAHWPAAATSASLPSLPTPPFPSDARLQGVANAVALVGRHGAQRRGALAADLGWIRQQLRHLLCREEKRQRERREGGVRSCMGSRSGRTLQGHHCDVAAAVVPATHAPSSRCSRLSAGGTSRALRSSSVLDIWFVREG